MTECCNNCRLKMRLEKSDYSQGGCIHTDYDGYACLAFANEGVVCHMVGNNPDTGICEMFTAKKSNKAFENEPSRER